MAFPTIPTAGVSTLLTSSQAAATVTHTFPSLTTLAQAGGDLMIAIIVCYQGGSANAEFSGWGGGFTEFVDQSANSTTIQSIGAAYKFSDGTETGTFTVTSVASTRSAMFLVTIPGAHGSTIPEATAKANGTTTAADPAALDPANWAAEDTLWIAVGVSGETSLTSTYTGLASAPANYGNYADTGIIGGDIVGAVEGAVAFRQLNASSENVAGFGVDITNAGNSALLIAVRPALAALATPAVVAGVTAIATPTAQGGAVAAPSVVAGTTTIATPGVTTSGDILASPAVVAGTTAIGATASASSTATPTVVAGTTTTPAPTASASSKATPTVVAGVATTPAPTASASSTATPAVVAGTGAVAAPTASASSTATPGVTAGATTIDTPSIITGGDVTALPAVVGATAAIPSPAISASSTVAPDAVLAVADVPAPVAQAGVVITLTTVNGVAAIATPFVIGSAVMSGTMHAPLAAAPGAVLVDTDSLDGAAAIAAIAGTAAPPALVGIAGGIT